MRGRSREAWRTHVRFTILLVGLMVSGIWVGCSEPVENDVEETSQPLEPKEGQSLPKEKLPFVEPLELVDTFIQRLPKPTELGENVAVHLKLPPPKNRELEDSLVRVLGEPETPLVVFRSDALVELGVLEQSPGREFFTALAELDPREIERRLAAERAVRKINEPGKTTLVFRGRTPIAVTTGVAFDARAFAAGGLVALGPCPVMPLSTQARWEESLLIRHPAVVQDPMRTRDACLGGGNPTGVWTFRHLMTQMSIGSGLSPHDFIVDWLEHWLNNYSVNSDVLPSRVQMFNQVIVPWANVSGVTATLTMVGGMNVLNLSGPLDLNRPPFRLSAIVNRIDLGGTVDGPAGYGGGTTSQPTDAGELRFVFGVQNLNTCNVMRFSVILEYGVPIEGCEDVRDWAVEWTKLNDPSFAAPFSPAWRAHLETLTESVVLHGAAPTKGNQNAINQIRTNENALHPQWELREFTLTIEDPVADTDTPANGPLRPHTVAMNPNDSAFFPPAPHPVVDNFVLTDVKNGVPASVPTLPDDCSASFHVPGQFAGNPFRGGNSFTAPPTHWEANVNMADNREVCARHQFSLNTCNGCHFADTNTFFFHVDPQPMPAALSGFLTGLGGVLLVPDTQFGTPDWKFADLDRRFKRLYEIACAHCGSSVTLVPDFIELMVELNEVVPIDPIDPRIKPPFRIGPVKDLDVVKRLFGVRSEFVDPRATRSIELDSMVRPVETFVH